jgi:hypothetical protein
MNVVQPVVNDGGSPGGAVHLSIATPGLSLAAEESERVLEQINLRATQLSQVLEEILNQPHDVPHWEVDD